MAQAPRSNIAKANPWVLSLGALGVVFGDIGTSPLYALREVFRPDHGLVVNTESVFGILSLVFWAMTLMISVKYLSFVLRADNRGEGGTLSLLALVLRTYESGSSFKRKLVLTSVGLTGAALLYGDGIITPAISVLSAVEGLSLVTPALAPWVIPITIFLINALFMVQRFGTSRIGVVFGPIVLFWFLVIGALGLAQIWEHPGILMALNPLYAVVFIANNPTLVFISLGAVVLVITGGEALYADMGHFGLAPIRRAWFMVAMPCLVFNYFGQGALMLENPEAIHNPFYLLAPEWAMLPMVLLATVTTCIASQALISGVFSLTRQAIQLGFWPRINIVHTSSREIGQVYVPFINWCLLGGVLWLVVTFQESSRLAAAYGLAVTLTMAITSVLAFVVARRKWKWNPLVALTVFAFFLVVDLAFLGANFLKITHGGWVPLAVAAGVYLLMTTWQKGRRILYARLKDRSMSIEAFGQQLLRNPPMRVPGTAIFMSGDPWGVPVPLLHNLKHNKVLHERVAILTIQTKEIPYVGRDERVKITEITPNFYRIIATYGFMEIPKMKHILEACRSEDIHFSMKEITFVLGRETILPSNLPAMPLWRDRLFALMSKNAQRPTAFFRIPPNQVIEVGIQVEI